MANTGMDLDVDESYLDDAGSASSTPSGLRSFYPRFKSLYEKKLWYQLTLTVEQFLNHPDSQLPPIQIDLYEKFVRRFSSKINQLQLAGIGVKVARQYADATKALAFLEDLSQKVDSPDAVQDAYVYSVMEAAHFKLLLGDTEGTKTAMDECGNILDQFDSVETAVHASFYRVSGDYYKAKAEYANYYKNSLLYLACVNVETDLTDADRVQRAHDLCISALLGDTIYNFGELLLHPILSSLSQSPHAWLSDMLFAFNAGDIGRFEALVPHLPKEPILSENYPFLRQKICLMALIESVFRRPADGRTIPFDAIASETKVPDDEVEHLVMKALSLKLIKGSLDQVSQIARITWVQPRVLDRKQIEALQARLNAWCQKVEQVSEFVKTQTPELFISA